MMLEDRVSSDITQSGMIGGEPASVAVGEADTIAGDGVLSKDDGTIAVAETAPPPFNPTMRDPDASTSETGMTVPPRPLDPIEDGEGLTCTGPEADRDLILGSSDGGSGEAAIPGTEGQDGATAPAVAPETPSPVDTASLFRDWAVMWSDNPSEVGANYGLDPSHDEVCLCDETSLAAGEGMADLAS